MNVQSSTIYVAGHRGLVGSALMRRFQAEGCRRLLARARAQMDLRDGPAVEQFFRRHKPKIVLLAAGRVGGIGANARFPADFIADNTAIELNVLGAARRHGAERVLFFGSSCMYPKHCRQPLAEKSLWSGPLEPTSRPYAVAKLAGLEMCLAFDAQDRRRRFLPLIANNVYGPGDDFDPESGHVLSGLIRRFSEARRRGLPGVRLWGSGRPRREFLYCDDLADACWHLLARDPARISWPLNVSGGQTVSIRELAGLVAGELGYAGRVEWDRDKPDGAPVKSLDIARLRALGWRPRTSLRDGLRETVAWYEANA